MFHDEKKHADRPLPALFDWAEPALMTRAAAPVPVARDAGLLVDHTGGDGDGDNDIRTA